MVQVVQFYMDKSNGYYYPQVYEDGQKAPGVSTPSPSGDGSSSLPGTQPPSEATPGNCDLKGKALEAAKWCMDAKNWNGITDYNNPGLDVSGSDGLGRGKVRRSAQCTDLVWAFVAYLEGTLGVEGGDSPAWNVEEGVQSVFGNYPGYADWNTVRVNSIDDLRLGDVIREEATPGLGGTHSEVVAKIDKAAGKVYYLTQNPDSPAINEVSTPVVGPPKGSWGTDKIASRMPSKYMS
jgi:hypothetical protein